MQLYIIYLSISSYKHIITPYVNVTFVHNIVLFRVQCFIIQYSIKFVALSKTKKAKMYFIALLYLLKKKRWINHIVISTRQKIIQSTIFIVKKLFHPREAAKNVHFYMTGPLEWVWKLPAINLRVWKGPDIKEKKSFISNSLPL